MEEFTLGYGESGLEGPGRDSSSTCALGMELTSSGVDSASAFGGALLTSGLGSGFSAGASLGVGVTSSAGGAGRALLVTGDGKRAFPICWRSS